LFGHEQPHKDLKTFFTNDGELPSSGSPFWVYLIIFKDVGSMLVLQFIHNQFLCQVFTRRHNTSIILILILISLKR